MGLKNGYGAADITTLSLHFTPTLAGQRSSAAAPDESGGAFGG